MKQPFTAVGVYIYAGGFTVGMSKHLRVLCHLEDGPFGVATSEKNLEVTCHTNPKTWPIDELKAVGVNVIYANPPCAPWSSAGSHSEVNLNDPRLNDHKNTLGLIDSLQPAIWMWESVSQVYTGRHDELSRHVTRYGMERGYSVYHFLHDAKFMGLPQARRRVMTILSKVAINFEPPKHPIVTVGEALAKVTDPGRIPDPGRYNDYIKLCKPGDGLRTIYLEAGNEPPGPKFMDHRIYLDRPSGTQIGSDHLIHPTEDRFLGVNEVAAICGYPLGYEFEPSAGYPTAQIARAVTPVVGNYMGRITKAALERNEVIYHPVEVEINYQGVSNRTTDYRMRHDVKLLSDGG